MFNQDTNLLAKKYGPVQLVNRVWGDDRQKVGILLVIYSHVVLVHYVIIRIECFVGEIYSANQTRTTKKHKSNLRFPRKYLKYQRVCCSGFSSNGALGEPNTLTRDEVACVREIQKCILDFVLAGIIYISDAVCKVI